MVFTRSGVEIRPPLKGISNSSANCVRNDQNAAAKPTQAVAKAVAANPSHPIHKKVVDRGSKNFVANNDENKSKSGISIANDENASHRPGHASSIATSASANVSYKGSAKPGLAANISANIASTAAAAASMLKTTIDKVQGGTTSATTGVQAKKRRRSPRIVEVESKRAATFQSRHRSHTPHSPSALTAWSSRTSSPSVSPLLQLHVLELVIEHSQRDVWGRMSAVCVAWRTAVRLKTRACGAQCNADDRDVITNNAQHVVKYLKDIYANYRLAEPRYLPDKEYMQRQWDLRPRHRAILIDWLVGVHYKFKFSTETLHLTANLIDRYLSLEIVEKESLQLVGIAAMFIASKYEEIMAAEVLDFVYLSDFVYSSREIIQMERKILVRLGWHITPPTSYVFKKRFGKVAGIDLQPHLIATEFDAWARASVKGYYFASYLTELALQEYKMLRFKPSIIAASSVHLALIAIARPPWSDQLDRVTGFTQQQLKGCASELRKIYARASEGPLQAIRKKFLMTRYGAVAQLDLP